MTSASGTDPSTESRARAPCSVALDPPAHHGLHQGRGDGLAWLVSTRAAGQMGGVRAAVKESHPPPVWLHRHSIEGPDNGQPPAGRLRNPQPALRLWPLRQGVGGPRASCGSESCLKSAGIDHPGTVLLRAAWLRSRTLRQFQPLVVMTMADPVAAPAIRHHRTPGSKPCATPVCGGSRLRHTWLVTPAPASLDVHRRKPEFRT